MYYDKQGNKIKDVIDWAKLLEDRDYKIIKQQNTDNKKYFVSTIWLGLNHNYGEGKPLIFETMVFKKSSSYEEDINRYSTIEEAKKGHKEMFNKWNKKI